MATIKEQQDLIYQDFNALMGRQPTPKEAETVRTSGKNVGQYLRANPEFLNKYPGGYVLTPGRGGWGQVTEGGEFQFITSPEELGKRRQVMPFEGEPLEISDQFIQAFMRSPFGASDEELASPISIPPGETITPVTPENTPGFLPEFKVNPQDVYSKENITQAFGEPPPPPETEPDLYGIREAITKELNLPGIQTELTGLQEQFNTQKANLTEELNQSKNQLRDAEAALQTQLDLIANQPVSMGVIAGQQRVEQRERTRQLQTLVNSLQAKTESANQKLDLLQSQIGAKQDTLRAAQQEAQERFGLRAGEIKDKQKMILQFPEAGIRFSDTTQQASEKIFKAQQRAENKELGLRFPEAGIGEDDDYNAVRNKIVVMRETQIKKDLDVQEYAEKKDLMFKYPGAKFGFNDNFETIRQRIIDYQDELIKKDIEFQRQLQQDAQLQKEVDEKRELIYNAPGAGIQLTDTLDEVRQKLDIYQQQVGEAQATAQAQKQQFELEKIAFKEGLSGGGGGGGGISGGGVSPTSKTGKAILTDIDRNANNYNINPEGFREGLIDAMVDSYGEDYRDFISKNVYARLPDKPQKETEEKPTVHKIKIKGQVEQLKATGATMEDVKRFIQVSGYDPEDKYFGLENYNPTPKKNWWEKTKKFFGR